MVKIDLTGKRFGRWVVLKDSTKIGHRVSWWCRCDCGVEGSVFAANLKQGTSTSCGCYSRERSTKHGHNSGGIPTSEYHAWKSMNSRCYSTGRKDYKDYGKRGIKVCDRWRHSFETFLKDMGEKPTYIYSLDRIDVDGNYEPNNCRWATPFQQRHNRRDTKGLSSK